MTRSKSNLPYCLLIAFLLGLILQTSALAFPFFEAGSDVGIKPGPHIKQMDFQVLSASCPSCVNAMTQMIGSRPGIIYVKVDMMKPKGAMANVVYNDTIAAQEDVMDAVHHFHFSEADVKTKPYKPPVLIPFKALPFMPQKQQMHKHEKKS